MTVTDFAIQLRRQAAGLVGRAGELKDDTPEVFAIWLRIVEKVRRLMGGKPPAVQCAAIPWRRRGDGSIEVLIATSRGTGRWVLPKGWPHKNMTLSQSAAQEALEEVGAIGSVSRQPVGHYTYLKELDNGLGRRVRVAVFLLAFEDQLPNWPERGERKLAWVSPNEAADKVDEPELAEVLRRFHRSSVERRAKSG